MKTKSIKFKVVFSIVGLIFFFGILATAATYMVVKNVLSTTKQEDFLATTVAQTDEARVIFNQSANLVKSIAENPSIVNLLESSTEDCQAPLFCDTE